jgi:arabinofuranan 3-O-arabinosyltransferase
MGLAFAQRPGKAVLDTRIELSADPGLFLHRVAAVWSSAGDLGHVQSGQFVGYLFPMAPWFAFAHWIGLPTWVSQRLWLGALIAVASWGVVRLMDELYSRRRGVAHLTAGVLYAANPYVAVWTTRGSVALLAYAAVPWLLLAAHRGMLQPRSWRWPALIGLVLACSGAGVNAGVVAWILPAPLALMLYEAAVAGRGWPALRAFGWRAGLCAAVGSAWWAVPLLIQSGYGTDFLSFTELPSSVWATPSLSESFRLLGYWPLYLGLGGTPVVGLASSYLFSAPVIVATLLVPLLAVGGMRWTRRWPYAPFFALLAVGALLAMSAGFPAGTPLRDGLTSAYYALEPLRFLRTSYKAAPLLGIALACLAGPALQALALKVRTAGLGRRWRLAATGALALGAAAVAVLYGLPMFEGRAIDRSQAYGQIPVAWRSAIAGAQHITSADRRIMLAPGALFGFYRWGNTVSSVGPALSKRPLMVRELVPYADQRAAGLQATVDDLVQQGRLVPGQFAPLLQLMAVGEVVVNADGLPLQSGSLDPAGVSEALRSQRGFAQPQARYGPIAQYPAGAGHAAERLPELRTYRVPGPVPGIVRITPVDGATVRDGGAEGIAELAAVGGLQPDRALFYAADLDRPRLAEQVRGGARLVFTDSNRRRVLEADLLRANQGPTLDGDDPLPRSARLGPLPRPSPDIPACFRPAVPSTAASRCFPSTGRSPRSTAGSRRAGWADR